MFEPVDACVRASKGVPVDACVRANKGVPVDVCVRASKGDVTRDACVPARVCRLRLACQQGCV